jgi:hypothetical protein
MTRTPCSCHRCDHGLSFQAALCLTAQFRDVHHSRALIASIANAAGTERANEVAAMVTQHKRDSAVIGREFGTPAPHNADLRDHYSFVAEIAAVIPVTI